MDASGGAFVDVQSLGRTPEVPMLRPVRRHCADCVGLSVPLSRRYKDKVKCKPLYTLGSFLESRPVQLVIMVLFILDIVIVLAELILETEILRLERDICELELKQLQNETNRTLAEIDGLVEVRTFSQVVRAAETPPLNDTGGVEENHHLPEDSNHTEHDSNHTEHEENPNEVQIMQMRSTLKSLELAEKILGWTSIGILGLFATELLILIIVFHIWFFTHLFYVFDLVIVGLTLGLELGLKGNVNQEIAAVIIFLRLWRLVRAGHGVFTLEGEQIAELKNKLRKQHVKMATLKSDLHEYQLEQECLEELLALNDIKHPNFSQMSSKFHDQEPKSAELDRSIFSDDEQMMLSRWLAEAIEANRGRVDQIRQENRDEVALRKQVLHSAGKRTFDLRMAGGKWLSTENSRRGPALPSVVVVGETAAPPAVEDEFDPQAQNEYEEFLKWKSK